MLIEYESLKKLIDNYEYISFDVFDTLLVRDYIAEPVDLFYLLAREKGYSHAEAIEFREDRIKSEKLNRELQLIKKYSAEINLEEI